MGRWICQEPLDLMELVRETEDHGTGALVIFVGTVRDTTEGQAVHAVTYEAHVELAERVLQEIEQEVLERFEVRRCRIRHRVGKLSLGEPSVIIVVRAGHRGPAFEAARYALEELKRRAPIWKEEHLLSGESRFVEGTPLQASPGPVTPSPAPARGDDERQAKFAPANGWRRRTVQTKPGEVWPMRDITAKIETLREALAEAFVAMPPQAQLLVRERRTEKGDALEVARAAGIMAAKRTWELLPFCHPLPLTHVEISYLFEELGVRIRASAKAIAPTGVEMEALTAASVAALTLYDMLKPHTQEIEIRSVRVLSKSGGKSDWQVQLSPPVKAHVLVLSDTVAAGKQEDRAGKAIVEALRHQQSVEVVGYEILPDDQELLQERVRQLVAHNIDLVLTVGGTGLGPADRTVEALRPLIEREVPGVMEAARAYGQRRTPYAMLSRGLAGLIKNTLVITLPGSTRGAKETYEALFPAVLHIFSVMRRAPHPHGYQ
jgi:cyclic pyranopterin monophosphate synthase